MTRKNDSGKFDIGKPLSSCTPECDIENYNPQGMVLSISYSHRLTWTGTNAHTHTHTPTHTHLEMKQNN